MITIQNFLTLNKVIKQFLNKVFMTGIMYDTNNCVDSVAEYDPFGFIMRDLNRSKDFIHQYCDHTEGLRNFYEYFKVKYKHE